MHKLKLNTFTPTLKSVQMGGLTLQPPLTLTEQDTGIGQAQR
jgi:hypothetical protein